MVDDRRHLRRTTSGEYHRESIRLASFASWPYQNVQRKEKLAEAGFYFLGPLDRVRCFICDVTLLDWKKTDDPFYEHKRHSCLCPFMLGIHTSNVADVRDEVPTPTRRVIPSPQPPPFKPEGSEPSTKNMKFAPSEWQKRVEEKNRANTETASRKKKDWRQNGVSGRDFNGSGIRQSLCHSSKSTAPCVPVGVKERSHTFDADMRTLEKRVETFTPDWIEKFKDRQDHEVLAYCGFYSSPVAASADRVKCAFCGIVVFGWEEGEDPFFYHALLNRRCHYINGWFSDSVDLNKFVVNHSMYGKCDKINMTPGLAKVEDGATYIGDKVKESIEYFTKLAGRPYHKVFNEEATAATVTRALVNGVPTYYTTFTVMCENNPVSFTVTSTASVAGNNNTTTTTSNSVNANRVPIHVPINDDGKLPPTEHLESLNVQVKNLNLNEAAERERELSSFMECKNCTRPILGKPVVIMPCGHNPFCSVCSNNMIVCPLCGKGITGYVMQGVRV